MSSLVVGGIYGFKKYPRYVSAHKEKAKKEVISVERRVNLDNIVKMNLAFCGRIKDKRFKALEEMLEPVD